MGTPTYAVPPWLRKAYPETTAHVATGVPVPYGARQDVELRPPRVPAPRRARHPPDRRPLRRPPGRHRLAGRQRAGPQAAVQPRRVRRVRPRPQGALRRRPRSSTAAGAWPTGRTGSRTWDELWTPGPQHDPGLRPRLAPVPGVARRGPSSPGRRRSSARSCPADRFVTTCIAPHHRGPGPLDDRAGARRHGRQHLLRDPGRPRAPGPGRARGRHRPGLRPVGRARVPGAPGRHRPRHPGRAVPRHRDERDVDRAVRRQPPRLGRAARARRRG